MLGRYSALASACGNVYRRPQQYCILHFGAPAVNFSTSSIGCKKQMPPRPKVSEDEIEEVFLKGSGPGGQKINKTNSAVQLRHIPTGLVVKSQATRSRESNRKDARRLLAEKLEVMEKGENSRKQIIGAIKQKKAASKRKKANRKYRKLENEREETATASNSTSTRDETKDTGEEGGQLEELEEAEVLEEAEIAGRPAFMKSENSGPYKGT